MNVFLTTCANCQMLAVKDDRKRAEYDVQLLANRLAFLRAEERCAPSEAAASLKLELDASIPPRCRGARAAAKKLEETKARTQEIKEAKRTAKQHDQVSPPLPHPLRASPPYLSPL